MFQSEEEEHVLSAICACKKLFWGLLERKQLCRGAPPAEEKAMSDGELTQNCTAASSVIEDISVFFLPETLSEHQTLQP